MSIKMARFVSSLETWKNKKALERKDLKQAMSKMETLAKTERAEEICTQQT
jgi:hypothetical protein